MDKSYLIHNIKIADDAADGHQTMDIELANLNVTGDDITADVTIIRKASGSDPETTSYEGVNLTGAGGGGGDYSEATITISGIRLGTILYLPSIFDDPNYPGLYTDVQEDGEYKIVLYKGFANCTFIGGQTISVSGDIVVDNGMIIITGDGTITMS